MDKGVPKYDLLLQRVYGWAVADEFTLTEEPAYIQTSLVPIVKEDLCDWKFEIVDPQNPHIHTLLEFDETWMGKDKKNEIEITPDKLPKHIFDEFKEVFEDVSADFAERVKEYQELNKDY